MRNFFKWEIYPIDEPSEDIFFPKSEHFSLTFEKGRVKKKTSPPSPSGYAPDFTQYPFYTSVLQPYFFRGHYYQEYLFIFQICWHLSYINLILPLKVYM